MAVLFKPSDLLAKLPIGFVTKPKAPGQGTGHAYDGLYREVAGADPERALRLLRTDKAGLSEAEAERRLLKNGPNEIAAEKRVRWYVQLWETANNPFNYLLVSLAV